MEELYPGLIQHGGFRVDGFAVTFPERDVRSRPKVIGQVGASFGLQSLGVRQINHDGNPSFSFRPLSTRFLANAISNDDTFKFSLTQERLGDVGYISGAGAREYGGDVTQGIISLDAVGGWSPEGLKLSMQGELGDCSALLGQPTAVELKQASYWVELEIPWMTLRFLFFDQINFVLSNYLQHSRPA
jgi:hypothetical protein